MKNKMNCGCCGEEVPTTCSICTHCSTYNEDGVTLLHDTYPDSGPGFVSRGLVSGTVTLGDAEAEGRVVFDYLDPLNYYAVSFQIDDSVVAYQNSQLFLVVYHMDAGVLTELTRRVIVINSDATLFAGQFCVSWNVSRIHAVVSYAGFGGSLVVTKPTDNGSGIVGYIENGNVGIEVLSYQRYPGEETDQGICPECDPVTLGQPCTCCPDGIAATWAVDTTGFLLTDAFSNICTDLNNTVFVLDREPFQPCYALFKQLFPQAYFTSDVELTIFLSITFSEDNCSISVTFSLDAFAPESNVYIDGLILIYTKSLNGISELCSGSHTLNLITSRLGPFEHCNGSVPATITVQSI